MPAGYLEQGVRISSEGCLTRFYGVPCKFRGSFISPYGLEP